MAQGIRAEVKLDADGQCPITQASRQAKTSTFSISRSVSTNSPNRMTEEFMLENGGEPPEPDNVELQNVFDYGDQTVYRFDRDRGTGCPCEIIEQFDCPVVDVHTRQGELFVVFHAADMEELRDVITTLQQEFSSVDVQRLLRSSDDRPDQSLVFVDRGALTDRQREVLETAHNMGYFQHPKGANAGEVANTLDITTSTFVEHLAAAQTKLLNSIVDS